MVTFYTRDSQRTFTINTGLCWVGIVCCDDGQKNEVRRCCVVARKSSATTKTLRIVNGWCILYILCTYIILFFLFVVIFQTGGKTNRQKHTFKCPSSIIK